MTHAQGQFTNYATAQDNVTAMLNSRLTSKVIGPYAFLLRAIIRLSSASDLLKGSVGRHLEENGDDWRMKIGRAKDRVARRRALQTGNSRPLKVVGWIENALPRRISHVSLRQLRHPHRFFGGSTRSSPKPHAAG